VNTSLLIIMFCRRRPMYMLHMWYAIHLKIIPKQFLFFTVQ